MAPFIRIGDAIIPGKQRLILGDTVFMGHEFATVVRYGKTLDSGGDPIFQKQKDFLYYGPEWNVWFIGAKESIFDNFKLSLHYNILYREHGIFDQLPYFNSELSYALDKDGDVDVKLTYERGREYETFEQRQVMKASLGYKF